MPGLRGHFRWSSTGITDQVGQDIASALSFLKSVKGFSSAVASFLSAVGQVEILHGQQTTARTAASTSLQFFPHGLGREYKSVILGAQDQRSTRLTVALASDVRAAGRDPALVYGVQPSAAVAVTFHAWVF